MANNLCAITDCGRTEQLRRELCNKHYHQWKSHANPTRRTTRTRNRFVVFRGTTLMNIYNSEGWVVMQSIVDEEDVFILSRHKWHRSNDGYVKAKINGITTGIGRYLLNAPPGLQVDHINRKPLDNRRSNLRLVTPRENRLNQGMRINNKSGYTGVAWDKYKNCWVAYKDRKNLGNFKDLTDAIRARKLAERVT